MLEHCEVRGRQGSYYAVLQLRKLDFEFKLYENEKRLVGLPCR